MGCSIGSSQGRNATASCVSLSLPIGGGGEVAFSRPSSSVTHFLFSMVSWAVALPASFNVAGASYRKRYTAIQPRQDQEVTVSDFRQ